MQLLSISVFRLDRAQQTPYRNGRMFFTLSKLIWAVLAPLNLVLVLQAAGAALTLFAVRAARSLFVLSLLILFIGGLLPAGNNMLALLENFYERPQALPERVDGILVLGGTFDSVIAAARGTHALNESGERVFEALALGKRYPDAIIVFSGGDGRLMPDIERPETKDLSAFLAMLGYSDDNVILEENSRNTYENIKYSSTLVWPQPEETWLLVTSAFHMPRAMGVARRQGWPNIMPYPVDYRTTGETFWWPRRFDMLGTMYDFHVALREYIGIMAYHITGRLRLPLH